MSDRTDFAGVCCPFCSAEISSDLASDPGLLPSPTVENRFYKRCATCMQTVAFVRSVGGALIPRMPNTAGLGG